VAVGTRRRVEAPSPEWVGTRFFREVFDELRKVVWPTPQELYRYTLVVVFTVLIISVFIGAVDAGVSKFAERFVYNGVTNNVSTPHRPGGPRG
jgi:preprotein translocase subunit SecE